MNGKDFFNSITFPEFSFTRDSNKVVPSSDTAKAIYAYICDQDATLDSFVDKTIKVEELVTFVEEEELTDVDHVREGLVFLNTGGWIHYNYLARVFSITGYLVDAFKDLQAANTVQGVR